MPQPNATLEALQRLMQHTPGCPICHFGYESGRRYIDSVMYESVNDGGLRQQLTQSLGFCASHSQAMLTIPGSKLGAAIIERAMLTEALRRIENARPERSGFFARNGRRSSSTQVVPDKITCPACIQERAAEDRALNDLLNQWDEHWARLLKEGGGLCLEHLVRAMSRAAAPVAEDLRTVHQSLWRTIMTHLDEFIRKQDYRFRDETISREEGEASRRAITVLTGGKR